jgi:hypothetical protein
MSRVSGLVLVLALFGCGRSSLLGGSPTDCPPGQLRPNGECGFDMGGDGGGGDGGMCPNELACASTCGAPGCCNCVTCFVSPLCQNSDGGIDGGDPCADKKNCMLPECVGDPRCVTPGTEICNNGLDDDDDDKIDCDDSDCAAFPGCNQMCDPLNPDCTLPDCADHPACRDLRCRPTVDFGTLAPMGASATRMVNTTGTMDVTITPCAPGGAGMVVGRFTLSGKADVTLKYSQQGGDDHVFGLFRAGINQTCGQNPVACYDPKSATMGQNTFAALEPGDYYVITQPFSPQGQGPVTVTLSTPSMKEICNNGVDDNGNGLIDCADNDCRMDPNCISSVCTPDFNVGALVVNGPGKSVNFDSRAATADNKLNCAASNDGKDVVVRFTLHETAGILVNWSQSGDHVLGLLRTPGPGQKCDVNQISCYDPSGRPQDNVAFGELPPGDYLFIWKALRPGTEGLVSATIRAYRNRQLELCHNGIDDDGNGLIDCADPGCIGTAGCSAPYCTPDRQLGTLRVGDSRSVTLNVQKDGVTGYTVPCAKGGAKGMVVQLTVQNTGQQGGIGIGFQCTQTGDHVIDLFAAGGPRDTCDVNELVCADPKTLPFGCGYIVPNLQPGTYNVIVAGFTPGSEGTMDLSLSIVDDRQLEICNNGIDDDRDGATDCQDRKCATNPSCSASRCRPDAEIDPVPLTGQKVFRLVQTAGNGAAAQLACTGMPGGDTAVIELTLTAAANLTLEWNQIGDHDFQLFTFEGTQLPCDAGATVGTCKKSNDAPSGMTSFTNVPKGQYYLVIQADTPSDAGSVNIALSGTPAP